MTSTKNNNIENLSLKKELINPVNNQNNNSIFNPDMNNIKQDLLFFKNDILKDIRKIEEKLNLKLTEQSVVNSEQYEAYEKKLDILDTKLTQVNAIMSDSFNLGEKFNKFQKFKSKAEDNLFSLNSRVITMQRESKDSIIKIEKIIDENLKYPGVIGKNSKFSNFRFFVDFVVNNIKLLNDFKEEIQNYDFNEFKNKVNSDLRDFRFVINDNYKNSRKLIENNIKDFNSKLSSIINDNNKKFEENEDKFKDLKAKVSDYLIEYQSKFSEIEKALNERYLEQINEINELKNMSKKFIDDIEKVKHSLKKNEKFIEFIKTNIRINNNNISNNINNNINNNNNNYNINRNNINNIINDNITAFDNNNKNKKILSIKNINSNNKIENTKEIFQENKNISNERNIKIYDNVLLNSEEKTNSQNTLEQFTNTRIKKMEINDHSKSFNNSHNDISLKNYYSEEHNGIRNTKENVALTQEEINYDKEKFDIFNMDYKKQINQIHFTKTANFRKKHIFQNNYSITNIPDIKIKKIMLPENVNNRSKILNIEKSNFSNNIKNFRIRSNNPSLPKKYLIQDTNSLNKNNFKVTRINKNKRSKMRSIKLVESARILGQRSSTQKKNLDSLVVLQTKNRDSLLNSLNNIRSGKRRSYSYEKEKKEKDEKVQIGFNKKYKTKNKFKELLLVNAKSLKKNRKINM